jgi:hypothetical protein
MCRAPASTIAKEAWEGRVHEPAAEAEGVARVSSRSVSSAFPARAGRYSHSCYQYNAVVGRASGSELHPEACRHSWTARCVVCPYFRRLLLC